MTKKRLAERFIADALEVLEAIGMPRAQCNDRSALSLLALLDLKPGKRWPDAQTPLMGITPIMDWAREHYAREYAPNTRETFRRQTMHQFIAAGLVRYNPDDPKRSVNSPKAVYQVGVEAHTLLKQFGSKNWAVALAEYLEARPMLADRYAMQRKMQMVPVQIAPGKSLKLSPGDHSDLIRKIVEQFATRFAPGAELIYVGDTGEKMGYYARNRLVELGVTADDHGKFPDVVLYFGAKHWLLLIESVTSHGPVDSKRHEELAHLFKECKAGLVYVTVFPFRRIMAKYLADISWETEVWCAEAPTHLIHFNGERFLGPYLKNK